MKILVSFAIVVGVLVSQAASAAITFTQLDDDMFTVSHRVKIIGSRGKATKMVFTKAASLCKAAGFTHLKVLDQESEANQADDAANATLRVQFYFSDGEGRIDCARNAETEYVNEASNKLRKRGYTPPARPAAGAAPASDGSSSDLGTCTLEQIAAMARAGLSDDKIRAACS